MIFQTTTFRTKKSLIIDKRLFVSKIHNKALGVAIRKETSQKQWLLGGRGGGGGGVLIQRNGVQYIT